MPALKISRKNALALFAKLGYHTADKWSNKRLEQKIKKLPEYTAHINFQGAMAKGLASILEALKEGREVVVVDTSPEAVAKDQEAKKEIAAAERRSNTKKAERKRRR